MGGSLSWWSKAGRLSTNLLVSFWLGVKYSWIRPSNDPLVGILHHVRVENSCPDLYWLGSTAKNLHCNLVKGIAYFVIIVLVGNHDENPCPRRLRSDVATMAQGHLSH